MMTYCSRIFLCLFLVFAISVSVAIRAQSLDTLLDKTEEDDSGEVAVIETSTEGTTENSNYVIGLGTSADPERISWLLTKIDELQKMCSGILESLSGTSAPIMQNTARALEEQLYRLIEEVTGTFPPLPDTLVVTGTDTSTGTGTDPSVSTDTGTGTDTGHGAGATTGSELVDSSQMAQKAAEIIEKLRAKGTKPGVGRGDSDSSRQMTGFPNWFGELQDLLCGSTGWTDDEEEGRNLLKNYAMQWAASNLPAPTFHTFPFFFQYLGCTESNDSAISRYNKSLPRSGNLGGAENQSNWCAWASNKCYMEPIIQAGYSLSGGVNWANNSKYIKQYGRGHANFSLEPGDYISTGQHALTLLKVVGNKALVISGNAGGGAKNYAGTVRIEEIDLSKITIVKKHSELSLATIQEHADDTAWLRARGLSKK